MFNSIYEVKMRILLLLGAINKDNISGEEIFIYDYMAIYGKQFGLLEKNLHGDNKYINTELSTRRMLTYKALKQLVIDNYVSIIIDDGIKYYINDLGLEIIGNMNNVYSLEYIDGIKIIIEKFRDVSDKDLFFDFCFRLMKNMEDKGYVY